MDPYNLKQDNRQRFQDKRRLKQKHATPSDRKYHNLKRAKELEEERKLQEEAAIEKLGNNFDRYDKGSGNLDLSETIDLESAAENEKEISRVRQRIKQVLREKSSDIDSLDTPGTATAEVAVEEIAREYTVSKGYTSRDLHMMDVDQLNALLGVNNKVSSTEHKTVQMEIERIEKRKAIKPIASQKADSVTSTQLSSSGKTALPTELLDDQDFLDSVI